MAEEATQDVFISLIGNANGFDAGRGSQGISYTGDAGLLDVLMGTVRLRLSREQYCGEVPSAYAIARNSA